MPNYYQNQFAVQPAQSPFFTQQLTSPTGNVYVTNTIQEANNVPVGAGTTVALCLPENLMYVKSAQNGIPMIRQFKLEEIEMKTPADISKENELLSAENKKLQESLLSLEEKVRMIEAQYNQVKGGKK